MTMLTVAEARAKARTRLRSSLSSWATQSGSAAVEIALHPPTEKQVLDDQRAAMDWAASWREIAAPGVDGSTAENLHDAESPHSPIVDWTERAWARIGRQQIPLRLRLRTPDAVAKFVGGDEARQWRRLKERTATIRSRFDDQPTAASANEHTTPTNEDTTATADDGPVNDPIGPAIKAHAKRILGLGQAEFDTLLNVVAWLRDHPVGTLRPRQLPIRGVDSKWFETHRSLVTALLTAAGRPEAVDVLDAQPRMRMRILDPDLMPSGLGDITAPAPQLSQLTIAPRLVFVFENLESVLAMPDWADAVAVHGSGYAVDNVARLAWAHGARVIYWGDLDSHGFAILSRLRTHLPHVESTLMDEGTLTAHRDLWVQEPKPHRGEFSGLSGTEARALARLRAEGDVRLEQERIPWDTALERLTASAGEPTTSASESAAPTGEQG
ncbi:Wadjet anti-phage system protein JetD domain-containing protein [Brevibacterium sandarakinum]|uniref:Wadjet anti-phage system protein JetD domain-containing protein n=1 Tax=Brevibacterium sandarakinum TaxID=629680 RepID=UPI00264C6FD6|nr:Wadjet anti-phage system protein JetD domain-containing protein [Brevibacterium sandarakinum]MDN5657002.1 DUF2220 family protein [Brevibacterium sandarakinum]